MKFVAMALALGLASQGASTVVHDGQASAPTDKPTEAPQVTRQALGEIVQRIDARIARGALLPASGERTGLCVTNEAFDRATQLFFGFRLVDARAALMDLESSLVGGAPIGGPEARSADGFEPSAPLRGDALRAEILEAVAKHGAAPEAARRALRMRAKLNREAPSTERRAEFLLDPHRHESELILELAALKRGEDPFRSRRGDHWRTFAHGRRNLAARVYLPESAPSEGMPLVVALHGAGGDENFLFELAGDGHIKRLADRHGCLVVCPLTPDFMFSGRPFLSLLKGIAGAYPYDAEAVYVLGHSMGAMATAKIAGWHSARLAGAACVAGFTSTETESLPITVVAGELDRIVSFAGVEAAAKESAKEGRSVTFHPLADQGHTLLLPQAMDLVFEDWFRDR